MAQMIPDEVPPGRSLGERILFSRLQQLPPECLVYYEPVVAGRYPDFVVIIPDGGLLIVECKGWRSDQMLGGDGHTIQMRTSEGVVARANPIRQAREYMHGLMDGCRRHPLGHSLLHKDGPHTGQFIFPFGFCVVLSELTEERLCTHRTGTLRSILPVDYVVAADELEGWSELTGTQLRDRLCSFFHTTWSFSRLTQAQVQALRTILHPEILVPATPCELAGGTAPVQISLFPEAADEALSIRCLDREQEKTARAIGSGHRLLFGVAGSGKTIVLLARARLLSELLPSGLVLVLCYSVSFKAYLQAALGDRRNVRVLTFHGWGARNGVRWDGAAPEAEYGQQLMSHLEAGRGEVGTYDAVLIDEAQDFDPTWFACAMLALKEPRSGDLLIVGDGNQMAYRRGRVSWRSLGIKAQGRTRYLTDNYRNSKAILAAAAAFADDVQNEDGIGSTRCNPESARRTTPPRPLLIHKRTRTDEFHDVVATVKGLLEGTLGGCAMPPLQPSDIGILYRRADEDLRTLISRLETIAPVIWLTPPDRQGPTDPRQRILEPGIKLQTIHAAKGLQYKAVLVVCADQIGAPPTDGTSVARLDEERRLLYVALTRPEDYLVVSYTSSTSKPSSALLKTLVRSGAFVWLS